MDNNTILVGPAEGFSRPQLIENLGNFSTHTGIFRFQD